MSAISAGRHGPAAIQTIEDDVLPPVSQGDVLRAALRRPKAIGIVDGYFEHVPSVWHKEILWAMSEGIHVFGSTAWWQLGTLGMVGVGEVFEVYQDGRRGRRGGHRARDR